MERANMMQTITIRRPDDFHVHLRDGLFLRTTVPHTAKRFLRAIVMPNLKSPIITTKQAVAYRHRILQVLPKKASFTPLMTLYLTDACSPEEIMTAKASGVVYGYKLYPVGVTTHATRGIQNITRLYPIFDGMQKYQLPLLIHGESIRPDVDIFDREKVFIDETLAPLVHHFPCLKIVLEHITTKEAVEFVDASSSFVGATITAHHLLYQRNDLFKGGIHPHLYCLPLLKRAHHRGALLSAAIRGHSRFFLGTDSAPHPRSQKESMCGCAGIYTAHAAIELYATVFEQQNALEKLESFASENGALFYGLPLNTGTLTLRKKPQRIPHAFRFGKETLVPLLAGDTLSWTLA